MAEQIKSSGCSTKPFEILADVTIDAERIVEETVNYFGKSDVLVNNVGILTLDKLPEIEMTEFDRIFDTNVRSIISRHTAF